MQDDRPARYHTNTLQDGYEPHIEETDIYVDRLHQHALNLLRKLEHERLQAHK
jgi:hypothetical protein